MTAAITAADSRHAAPLGVAFKPAFFDAVLADGAVVDFFEVHAENYLGAGGEPHRQLHQLGARWPLSIHGVGLSLGGLQAPDAGHVARIKQLLHRHPAALFSEHLAWSSHGDVCLPDLLPIDYDDAAFVRVAAHIDALQDALGRRVLIENPSRYLRHGDPLAEVGFLSALHQHTGCGLLLDLNNVVVSCHNQGLQPRAYLSQFPFRAVQQIHLGGHSQRELETGATLAIDDHASAIPEPVLDLYVETLQATGPVPTLIEWDHAVPEWPVLRAELARVRHAARLGAVRAVA